MNMSEKWYHGSGVKIDSFDERFLGIGNDGNGSGFYFTNDFNEAIGYTGARIESYIENPGGEDNLTVMEVSFNFDVDEDLYDFYLEKESMNYDGPDDYLKLSQEQAYQIIKLGYERCQDQEDYMMSLYDFGDADDIDDLIYNASVLSATDATLLNSLNSISNTLFKGQEGLFCRIAKEVTGFRGVLKHPSNPAENAHVAVWDKDDITIIKHHTIENEKKPSPAAKQMMP